MDKGWSAWVTTLPTLLYSVLFCSVLFHFIWFYIFCKYGHGCSINKMESIWQLFWDSLFIGPKIKNSTVLHRACYYTASFRVCTTIEPPTACTPLKIYSNMQLPQNVLHHPAPLKRYPNMQPPRIYYNMKPAQSILHYPPSSKYTSLSSPLKMFSTMQPSKSVLHYAAPSKYTALCSLLTFWRRIFFSNFSTSCI